jgi:hypothetical protein
MKPLSPLAHAVGDDSPTVGMCDCLAGARPVAGTALASGLILVVCSWFALQAGGLGRRHDVGQPTPVRLQTNPVHRTQPAPHTPTRTVHARADVRRPATAPQRHNVSRLVHDTGTPSVTAPALHPGRLDSSAPAPQPARTTPSPATSQPSQPTSSTTELPAPLDELPTSVTVPPTAVTPGATVTLPQASVPPPPPIVTNATSTLGPP